MRNMSNDKKNFRREQKNRGNRDFGIILPEDQELNCIICGKPIADAASSMAMPDSGEPAHFDCVLKQISESETLAEGDTVAYLGGGAFGIIQKETGSPAGFRIKKKIDFENKEKIGVWRKKLSYKL